MTILPVSERILAAIAERIGSVVGGEIPGLTVERERLDPVSADIMPLVVLYEGDRSPDPLFCGESGWSLPVSVQGIATGATPLAARQASGLLEAWVLAAVTSPERDLTFGGLVRDVVPDPESRPLMLAPAGDDPCSAFSLSVTVSYATAEGDPFTPA